MTRKWFLGLIGLGAAGQSLPDPRTLPLHMAPNNVSPACGEIRTPACGAPVHKPRNGECPVCGTMAPAYKRMMVGMGFMAKCKPTPNYRADDVRTWVVQCEEVRDWDGPATRTVSCAHCRVRFDQDAEEGK